MDFDLSAIEKILDMVGDCARSVDGALRFADIFKERFGSPETPRDIEMQTAVAELMSELLDAKLSNISLKEDILELRTALLDVQKAEKEFARYSLCATPAGSVVYRLKENDAEEDPPHYICPKCKETGIKSILQGGDALKECPSCSTPFHFKRIPSVYTS